VTTSPPPAAPRTQEIPVTGEGATAGGATAHTVQHAAQHPEGHTAVPVTAPATLPPSALPAPAYPVTSPQPVTTAEPAHGQHASPGQPAHSQPNGPLPTGPLDSLLGAPPVPPPAAPTPRSETPPAPRAPRAPRDRVALVAAGLAALGLVLLQLGLFLRPEGSALWGDVPAWSVFATLCALLAGVAAAVRLVPALRLRPAGAERIALGGLTGLAVFWALVVLPRADTDRGFVLTMALAAVAAAVWLVPGRRR
jgi:hypothetical protein